jgi:hypothetical protein
MSDHDFQHYHGVKRTDSNTSANSLRASNFKLGNWVPSMKTTVNRQFYAKKSDIPTVEEQNARRNQMRS